ncbi:MAG: YdbH domain-containing protein [Novosphingobium sp.]
MALLFAALLAVWLARDNIAHKIIRGQLESYGLPATYKIEKIGPTREVLTDIVVGDPAHPDLTIERADVRIVPTFGFPTIGEIALTRPRLFGRVAGGRVSFGTLYKVIYANKGGSKGLPDLDLRLIDGRARIDTSGGPIGLKADGAGNLRGGFKGMIAAIAPKLATGGCRIDRLSVYGAFSVVSAEPHFTGPVRMAALDCPASTLSLRDASVQVDGKLGAAFDSADASYALSSGRLTLATNRLTRASGAGRFSLASGDMVISYKLKGEGASTLGIEAAALELDGIARSHDKMASFSSEGALRATGVASGHGLEASLSNIEKSAAGTLVAPLAAQLRTALAREATGSTFAATYQVRQSGQITSLTVPGALWRGRDGGRLAALSRVTVMFGGRAGPALSGNIVSDGPGLPHIDGRFERRGDGGGLATLRLDPYRAGDSVIALPELKLVQLPNGAIGFAGQASVSGALPGGQVQNLVLPIEGNWSAASGLSALRKCTPVRFDRLKVSNLTLAGQTLTLCPGPSGAIVRSGPGGLRIAAGTAGLALNGSLGTTAIRLRSGAVGMAWPGALVAKSVDVSFGPVSAPSTLKLAQLNAILGKDITGTFAGTDLKLYSVPLDVLGAAGKWRFANKRFDVSGASLTVKDRLPEGEARFYPLIARDATLSLVSTTFTADALLREPKSDRVVTEAKIVHDLDTAIGHADLLVPGIVFDRNLQPERLTYFTQGVIGEARGTIYGKGRIDWDRRGVTSSGDFTTDKFDFAALFGPVSGLSGTVHFTDLLGLVTAPDQKLRVAAINPGIEVNDGDVSFQLEPGHILAVNGAKWPFIDGSLELLPTRIVIGGASTRRFTIQVRGLNLEKFVSRLNLSNISASGFFDGQLPMVFDQNGGRIENGILISRDPGGNISYVGELTYKDLSPMGNFAFQALRSLDYKHMEVALQGRLDGEIVTKMQIDGISQGQGAKRNFITQRFAKLPIRFNISIKGPFHALLTNLRSLYDPSYVRDPRELGLIPGGPTLPGEPQPTPAPPATAPSPPKNDNIQHSDSRTGT